MIQTRLFKSVPGWIRPAVVVSLALLVSFGCKEQSSSSPPPSGGMPPPSSGGMPAPSGGGMPSPPSGGTPPPSQGSGSSGDAGTPAPPMPSGGSPGDGSESGDSNPTGDSEGGEGSSGEIGSFPGEESSGAPPMPGTGGAGEGTETGGEESTSGGGESEESSDWDEEGNSTEECGDTGALPGGVGGMGQDGECIGGGESASDSDSSSEASGGGGGGSSDGEETAVQGTGGAGEVAEFPTESSDERAERLGKELDESIGGFDEVLMEEQEEISSVGRNTEGFGGGVEGDGGISLGQQASNSTAGIMVANNGALPQAPTSNMSEEQIRERTPEDIPVMVDEDIIARQLREAALSEEDPELRDRLWEEYRKYRGN